MTDENAKGPNGEDEEVQPMTAPVVPVLAVQRERLSFITEHEVHHLDLADILKGAAAGQGPVGMLLYAIVLQLHAVDTSLRRAIDHGASKAAGVQGIADDPVAFVDKLLARFTDFAVNGPGAPGAVVTPAGAPGEKS